jgi:hypothetical protein
MNEITHKTVVTVDLRECDGDWIKFKCDDEMV